MSATATADPIRAQVEDALHRIVVDAALIPCRVMRRARRAAGRTADRAVSAVVGPVGLVRSIVELGVNGLLAVGDNRVTPTPSADPVARSRSESAASARNEDPPAPRGIDGDHDPVLTDLPLHGYESLAASHVVARLERLTLGELEQIRDFEVAHRGRRTILGKIDQLLAPA
jgi:hypothetical protein